MRPLPHRSRWRDHSRARERRPVFGTYRDDVSPSADVNRARFSRLVARVLSDAHDRGLTDKDIARITGVGTSTFHRWRSGQLNRAPDLEKVRAFFGGLGVSTRAALLALGVEEGRDDPEPEPAMDPDVRRILRALADPNVPEQEKLVIREMLKMIARRSTGANRQINA
jgi:transcriptional regulator with XRE-family HTH domain